MSVEKAKAYYTGKQGHKKLNCAQAVAGAFKDKFSLSDDDIEKFAGYSGGRAPDGRCGALYVAGSILEKVSPEKVKDCEKVFLSDAGSIKCREIRAMKKLSCAGCVEKVAQYIEKV